MILLHHVMSVHLWKCETCPKVLWLSFHWEVGSKSSPRSWAQICLNNAVPVEVTVCQFLGQAWGNWELPLFYILAYSFLELRHNDLRKSSGSMETSMWRKIYSQKKSRYHCLSWVHLANVRWKRDEISPLGPAQTEDAWKKAIKISRILETSKQIECLEIIYMYMCIYTHISHIYALHIYIYTYTHSEI